MTTEEIKQMNKMIDVVSGYGIYVDRKGFCCCPFHNEKTASMKVYKDSYYCFGCHESGDIFKFVQGMDNCDFRTAYLSLGGTYEKQTRSDKLKLAKARRERNRKKKDKDLIKIELEKSITMRHAARELMNKELPGTDDFFFYLRLFTEADQKVEMLEGVINGL